MRNRVQSSVYGRQPRALREEAQAARAYERERGGTTNRRLYRTSAWRALRAQQLDAHPDCCVHGCMNRATVVDHRTPHRGQQHLFFDPANLQSMCKVHHDSKTARHDGGFGNRVSGPPRSSDEPGFGLL
jgi:5-methylcytosine-specific restriction protein A